eukprot:scaffold4614_cov247-Pinguiococcus_pyrenoidosus.AAC.14
MRGSSFLQRESPWIASTLAEAIQRGARAEPRDISDGLVGKNGDQRKKEKQALEFAPCLTTY